MESRCGYDCTKCNINEKCKGCIETKGHPFGGDCVLYECCKEKRGNFKENIENYKRQVMREFNELHIEGMPRVTELYALVGSSINMEYGVPSGERIKFLKVNNVYLGCELPKMGTDRLFGIVCDNDYLLVSEYGMNRDDAEIVIYKKRDK